MKILIAEDESALSKALQIKLTDEGLGVDVAHDGEEAIRMLQENKYDVILVDLMMPGKSGLDVIKFIKKNNIEVKIIVDSNLSQEQDKEEVEALGVKDFIIKSNVSIEEIIQKINSLK
ncbi:response regulator [Candidatus Dojkabacteria bacterium]|uniref:Response regulator n=1 Tax=Candidatus Dojkabacteria bacterium TaxID=2099670 RepID=A0A955IAJ3_9BACT|nr:response regulator [Candidatus Dojkabacteria bacterium]